MLNCHAEIKKIKTQTKFTIALAGNPNVGKSTLMNQLLSKERVIVSSIPGTTIDSIDSAVEVNQQKYLFIDTAGLRKKRNVIPTSIIFTNKASCKTELSTYEPIINVFKKPQNNQFKFSVVCP